jgi:hypothetical protein
MVFDPKVVIAYWAAAPRSMDDIEDRISGKCDLQHLCSFHLEILRVENHVHSSISISDTGHLGLVPLL